MMSSRWTAAIVAMTVTLTHVLAGLAFGPRIQPPFKLVNTRTIRSIQPAAELARGGCSTLPARVAIPIADLTG